MPATAHLFRRKSALGAAFPVYGIYEDFDEQSETGHYRRIELVALRLDPGDADSEFCKARFLDGGGYKIVPLASILRIHSKFVRFSLRKYMNYFRHCDKPPFSLQCRLDLPTAPSDDWGENQLAAFRRLMRSDLPMECTVTRIIP